MPAPIGLSTAASGLAAQQARLDALANDIANVETAGYRPSSVAFSDLLYQREGGVAVGSGVGLADLGRSATPGSMNESANPLAVAIDGAGFLQVRLADGSTGLTRAGDLQLDAQGNLVTATGQPLEPRIQVPAGTKPKDVVIAADGTVTAAGQEVGKIQVVDVSAPSALVAAGGGILKESAASGAAAPSTSTLRTGMLEASGVNIASAMTELVEAQRAFALQSRVIKTHDQLAQIANDIRR